MAINVDMDFGKYLYVILGSLSIYAGHSSVVVSSTYRTGFTSEVVIKTDSFEDWQGWFYIRSNIHWGMGSLFLFLFFLLFYKVVPTGKMKFKEVLPGALFSTIGWQLFSLGFGRYVSNVDYTMLYGQLSGIILLVTLVLFHSCYYFIVRFIKCGVSKVVR